MNIVEEHDNYFVQKSNATGVLGLSCLQKVAAAFKMIAYGVPADATDYYVCVGESTTLKCLRRFTVVVVEVFRPQYLRLPNEQDTAKLLAIAARRGFYAWFHQLYVLELKKLSYCMTRNVPGP
jgi:hypothetical protein